MTLIVPAGGTFSIGSNVQGNASTMNMSLDDVIASRRKDTATSTRRGGRSTRASTSDKAVASGRAKRQAALNARRNLTTTKKPTKMEIDTEVKAQTARTQRAKANQDKKKAGGRVAATRGRTSRAAAREAGRARAAANKKMQETKSKQATVQLAQGRPPSKKAVNAAVQAFKANGFNIPQGTQMVIRFEGPASPPNNAPKKGGNTNNNNNNARNAARAAGRARAAANNNNNNNNNTRNTRSSNNNNNNRRGGRGGGRGRN